MNKPFHKIYDCEHNKGWLLFPVLKKDNYGNRRWLALFNSPYAYGPAFYLTHEKGFYNYDSGECSGRIENPYKERDLLINNFLKWHKINQLKTTWYWNRKYK